MLASAESFMSNMAAEHLIDRSSALIADGATSNTRVVRQLPESEYLGAGLTLAQAFEDDQLARYFVDTPDRSHWTKEEKWDLHLNIMQCLTFAHCIRGLVTTVGEDYGSVALWIQPFANMDTMSTFFQSGVWRLVYKLSRIGRRRFFWETFPTLHKTKVTVLGPRDESSYYLVYLGTKRSARGKGYARQLIEHMSDRADREGRACYLESTSTKNLALYRRCGYETQRHIFIGDENAGGVPLDIMVREPQNREHANGIPAAASATEQCTDAKTLVNGDYHMG